MTLLNSGDLAKALNVSKGRVSQYVSEGKLSGCFTGAGRDRRFDLEKVAVALGRQLHPGQMMGNGAQTRAAIRTLGATSSPGQRPSLPIDPSDDEDDGVAVGQGAPKESAALARQDPDRYELARIDKVEQEARKLRRMNAEAEGTYVLASEVERQVGQVLAQEIAEVEAVLRDGARRVADKLGVDFKAVLQIMMDQWRSHRASRTAALQAKADGSGPSAEEIAEDI
jgi:hypothetical protein